MWEKGPYNENKPFGKGATVVEADNIQKSSERYQAMKAMREGRATNEQKALVYDCDRLINQVLDQREREDG